MSSITEKLYQDYYVSNKTPEAFVSSYWKFWHTKSTVIVRDGKIEKFKGVGFGELQAKSFLNRGLFALSIQCHLRQLECADQLRELIKIGKPVARRMGLNFTNDCFRQICAFELMSRQLKNNAPRVIIIGDGYGFLSALIKEVYPKAKICLIDLGKTLLFQAHDLQKAFAEAKHQLATEVKDIKTLVDSDFVYCPAEHLESINAMKFDIAFNICSMQEMNAQTIAIYFDFLRGHLERNNLFYCCNRIERPMEGGEVSRFYEYPWDIKDNHFVDAPCPWNKFFLAVKPAKNGPKIFGFLRVPFVNFYDGPIQHRLSQLNIKG